jgi:hypothetical protein
MLYDECEFMSYHAKLFPRNSVGEKSRVDKMGLRGHSIFQNAMPKASEQIHWGNVPFNTL